MNRMKDDIKIKYGWYFLAKSVADFCNLTYFDVFERTAQEILSVVMIINATAEINAVEIKNKYK